MSKEYDLVVLGGGTGGYVGAIRAAQLGMNVAIVEKEKIGGTCLHKGCIPSKALLKTAEYYRKMKEFMSFGIEISDFKLNFTEAQNRKNKIINQLYAGVQSLMKKGKIDVYNGFGRIMGSSLFSPIPGTISVEYENGDENSMLVPKHVLISTGSSPRSIKDLNYDGNYIIHSDHVLELEELPESIVIVGGGVIGIEWASMLTDLDVNVTVVESSHTILIDEDDDVRREVQASLESRGVTFFTQAQLDVSSVKIDDGVSLTLETNREQQHLQTDKLLVSIGRESNISGIGIENTTIETEKGYIVTNQMYQTEESHIYAIGDCIGGLQLAHVASAEAIVAVEHMNELSPLPIEGNNIPSCIYSYPEVAKIGYTEQQASDKGYEVKVGKFPFTAIGKAHVNGEVEGFCKIITDKHTEDILGVHLVGPQATELISEASLAKILDATAWEISKTIHPHPALSEVFVESALSVEQLQIHG